MAAGACSDGLYAPTGETIDFAFARMRVADRPGEEAGATKSRRTMANGLTSLPEPTTVTFSSKRFKPGEGTPSQQAMALRTVRETLQRKFFVADTGHIGLAHWTCEAEDQIWLLMGGDTPFILRPQGGRQVSLQR